jgi:hypothetical protein
LWGYAIFRLMDTHGPTIVCMTHKENIKQPWIAAGELDSGLTRLSWTNVPVRLASSPELKAMPPVAERVSPSAAPASPPPAQA